MSIKNLRQAQRSASEAGWLLCECHIYCTHVRLGYKRSAKRTISRARRRADKALIALSLPSDASASRRERYTDDSA